MKTLENKIVEIKADNVIPVDVKRCKFIPVVNEDEFTYSKMEGFYEGVFNDCMDKYTENIYTSDRKNKSLMDYKA